MSSPFTLRNRPTTARKSNMPLVQVKRKVKLTTSQQVMDGAKPVAEGFPMREWSIVIHLLDEKGKEVTANVFDKVIYKLHPTFVNPNRTIKKPPFKLSEQGWGEFDMEIVLYPMEKGQEISIKHDLNFQKSVYESKQEITFVNPKPGLLRALAQSGPVPGLDGLGEENGTSKKDKRKGGDDEGKSNKKGRSNKNIDMEKLAEGMQKLDEDDLLKVVQMIHEHKTPDTYTKNDVEQGEFHVDLYTLPDHLVKNLWQFTTARVEV
ncbi:hypothetical protein ABW21_db0200681 [Orbilia brochopaga]|nr:hypothetical protein ABW21_db0200681 [Drechslerella brochopaga]